MPTKYWLMKSEPDVYSIHDLKKDKVESWEGVRNYQARNFMRDDMRIGDLVIFYHSNTKPPGAAGIARVCRQSYPDHTQFDPKSKYFDPKASKDKPRWFMVDLAFEEAFEEVVSLEQLKSDPNLSEMLVVQKGQRLSVQPVRDAHFNRVRELGRRGVRSKRTSAR